ncbi:MAG TPA: TIGR02466 family protein [Alphaproteobacteria bacterium]
MNCPLSAAGPSDSAGLWPSNRLEDGSFSARGIFPTSLVSARLKGHAEINARLAATILAREAVEQSAHNSNVGGWHSHDFQPWAGEDGQAVIAAARDVVNGMTLMQSADEMVPASVTWRVTAWANVSRTGAANRPHCHPAAFWSGVYWVADGGVADNPAVGGLFEIADPRGVLPLMHAPHLRVAIKDCLSDGHTQLVTPRAGTMILFPAWLVHSVQTYTGDRPRISVAFNFSL